MEDIYDAQPSNFIMRGALKFLEALDLSNNLVKVNKALKGVPNGAVALIIAIGTFFGLLGVGSLAYYFDINSSWTAMEPLRVKVVAVTAGLAGAVFLGWLVQFVPTALTVLPTVSEMLGARFARFNIPAFQVLTWMFISWDLATDIPRVNENLSPYWGSFVQGTNATGFFGILFTFSPRIIGGAIGYHVVWFLALLGASYFLELLTVLLLWAFVALMWKSLGYWAAKLIAGRRSRFQGDMGGEFDTDFQGDEVHSREAADFGHTGRSARRSSRRPSARGGGGMGRGGIGRGGIGRGGMGGGRRPVSRDFGEDEFGDDEFGEDDFGPNGFGGDFQPGGEPDWDTLEEMLGDVGGGPREVGPRGRAHRRG